MITPRQVILGLGTRRVKIVAAAKHHTVIATEGGEVFTWGSNRGTLFCIFILLINMFVLFSGIDRPLCSSSVSFQLSYSPNYIFYSHLFMTCELIPLGHDI